MAFKMTPVTSSPQSVTANKSTFLVTAAAGAIIAGLSDPFAGMGYGTTTYQPLVTPPGQLALSGSNVVVGSSASTAGTGYGINVLAVSGDGNHETGQLLTFTAQPDVPAAPTITVTPGNNQNSIAWTDGAANGSAIVSHDFFRGTATGMETLLTSGYTGGSPFVDASALNGQQYFYQARARNGVGPSVLSAEVSGTPSAVGGLSATSFAIAPTAQWHAGQSTITMRANKTVTGYISNGTSGTAGQILTVTQIDGAATNGPDAILEGMVLTGGGVASGTSILKVAQTSGGNGGPGNYVVSVSQAVGTSGSPVTFTIAATQVASVSDLMGNINLTSADGEGPRLMTDALGRKFLRFIAPANYVGSWLNNQVAANLDTHNFSSVAVCRVHISGVMTIACIGSKVAGTGIATPNLCTIANGMVSCMGLLTDYNGGSSPSNANKLFAGTQLQVLGSATATNDGIGGSAQGSANTTTLAAVNEQTASLANTNVRSTKTGIEIGKTSSGSTGTTGAQYAFIDLYELSIWTTGQLGGSTPSSARSAITANFNAAQSAAMSNFAIPAITDSLLFAGDSRSVNGAGFQSANGADGSGLNLATIITEPGSPVALPATTRVLNISVTGHGVGALAAQFDRTLNANNRTTPLMASMMLGGGHDKVHWYSGINDLNTLWPIDNYAAATSGQADEMYGTDRAASFTATVAANGISMTYSGVTGAISEGSRISFSGANTGLTTGIGAGRAPTSPVALNQYEVTAVSSVAATSTLSSYKSCVEFLLNRGFKVVWAREISYGTDTAGCTELRARVANCVADVTADIGATLAANLKTYDLSQITVGGSAVFGSAYVGYNVLNNIYVDGTHQTAVGKRYIVSGGDTPANGVYQNVR